MEANSENIPGKLRFSLCVAAISGPAATRGPLSSQHSDGEIVHLTHLTWQHHPPYTHLTPTLHPTTF